MRNPFKELAEAVAQLGVGFGRPGYDPEPSPFEREDRINELISHARVEAGTHGLDEGKVENVLGRVSRVVNRMLLWMDGDPDWWDINLATARVTRDLNRLGDWMTGIQKSKLRARPMPQSDSKLASALVKLMDHPHWTNRQIAEAVGCSKEYLSRSSKFRAARVALKRTGAAGVPRGSKRDGFLEAEN